MRKIDRERFTLLERIEKRFITLLERLENDFLRQVIQELETILIIEDGKVKNITKNHVNLHKLGFFQDNFRKTKVLPFVGWIAKQLVSIAKINSKYFNNDFNIARFDSTVQKQSLSEIGVSQDGKLVKIARNSLIDQISKFESPYMGIRNVATQAIAQEMTLDNFKKLIRKEVKPQGKYGSIKHHFYTLANDLFARHDRNIQKKYAERIGLRTFIYTGGLIQTSRDFCEDRNGKVFTIEEAEEWKNLNWDGKPEIYNPLIDLGGYNCRHFPAWISAKEAIRRRPDLKQYFENLD